MMVFYFNFSGFVQRRVSLEILYYRLKDNITFLFCFIYNCTEIETDYLATLNFAFNFPYDT